MGDKNWPEAWLVYVDGSVVASYPTRHLAEGYVLLMIASGAQYRIVGPYILADDGGDP